MEVNRKFQEETKDANFKLDDDQRWRWAKMETKPSIPPLWVTIWRTTWLQIHRKLSFTPVFQPKNKLRMIIIPLKRSSIGLLH